MIAMSTKIGTDRGRRDEQAGEVDLRQQMLLADQALCRPADPRGEERPGDQPGEDEHRVGEALRGDLREPPKISVKITIVNSGWRTAQATPRTVCL